MQKQDHFERYSPQYPLPVDITNMSRQDTVCQFCGVSYLIHNEIKALEAKCQKLEADLTYYADMNSRESALEQTLQNERTRISDLESTIVINTHKLNEMTRKLQLIQDQLEQSESAHQETKRRFSEYASNLRLICHEIQNIRKEYSISQDLYINDIQNWKTYLHTVDNSLQKEIRRTMDKNTKQMCNYQTEIEQYQKQLNETNQSFRDLQIKYQKSQVDSNVFQTITQNDLEAAQKEIIIQQTELSSLREQISQLEQTKFELKNDLKQIQQYSQQLETQLSEKDQTKTNNDLIVDQYRQQLSNEKELRLKADDELENIRSKFLDLTNDYDQLNRMKTEFETNELNTRRKIDEMSRSRQAVLDRTRDEYEKLLRKYTDLDEVYQELANLQEKDILESKTTRAKLERLHDDNTELRKQRETLEITHDIQIKKLHDSYSIKLHDAEKWPDHLQTELNREREQHRIQMHELEQRLTESFLTELNIEKQKYMGLLRKYEHDSDHSTEQLRQELLSTEKVTIEQRSYYTKQIERLEKDKHDLKNELDKLRNVLKELHEQINKQESMNSDRVDHLKLKEDLLTKETSLFQAQSTINELQKCLEQIREEMLILQETVHKECTEREQLKDALIDARQQLLATKKNSVLNGAVSRSLHSPPVAFEELEKRVPAPLSYSQNYRRNKITSIHSEPASHDNSSIPNDAADLIARSMPSSQNLSYRYKALPPIHYQQQQQQQQQRRNRNTISSNKSEQLLENQRRIARFIKHIK
ncbi:unnamed protein product [Rotaria socialis]|uniref:Uncharacterized protein n=1 Tax=Rotaria socialis TaxID=392032 RepID=A0A821EP75_9BILA|nr:unnamed protein product [Rotaria socialis]CAF4639201.1 unnamed protein product [Rotaria socialis]